MQLGPSSDRAESASAILHSLQRSNGKEGFKFKWRQQVASQATVSRYSTVRVVEVEPSRQPRTACLSQSRAMAKVPVFVDMRARVPNHS